MTPAQEEPSLAEHANIIQLVSLTLDVFVDSN